MRTKVCKKCGWVLAIQDPTRYCPICKTRFYEGICTKCKQPVEYYRDRLVCRKCYDTVVRRPDEQQRVKQRRAQIYKEWLARIAKVPKTYPTLTEDQWLKACKYFGGCAFCGAESIDSRGYFVPFSEGGRYCDWNMLPLCERCATATRLQPNAFASGCRPKRLVEIINYLEDKLNAASES